MSTMPYWTCEASRSERFQGGVAQERGTAPDAPAARPGLLGRAVDQQAQQLRRLPRHRQCKEEDLPAVMGVLHTDHVQSVRRAVFPRTDCIANSHGVPRRNSGLRTGGVIIDCSLVSTVDLFPTQSYRRCSVPFAQPQGHIHLGQSRSVAKSRSRVIGHHAQ